MSKFIFTLAAIVLCFGVFKNVSQDSAIAGTGTMAMNSYYLLSMALFAAAAAAELIWGRRTE
ncbi:hypothetical protein K32_49070 [Kaistia sp. 32K]|uniref:hypothetical protein n=1 Tax=Kaistia sp. 32K TaxID=2795690 RepID=UPI0019161CA0|nr:hypothetical protein [Kaistia sp. 32K]BCP56290.1 hypothetical protein K32_49070 [Kaistia sp. 32K]